jgi:hypothetical protein
MLTLDKFKLIKNKQRPTICYKYVYEQDNSKFTIFTLNGTLFHCSIEKKYLIGKKVNYSTLKSEECLSIDKCLEFLNKGLVK